MSYHNIIISSHCTAACRPSVSVSVRILAGLQRVYEPGCAGGKADYAPLSLFLKESTLGAWIIVSGSEFQLGMVLGKNEFLYILDLQ